MWKVGHVQQGVSSVRRMAQSVMLKDFEEVSEVLNTSLNAMIFGMMVSQDSHAPFFALLATAPLVLINLATILNSLVPRPLSEARD